jgi:hypothetical protein
LRNKLQRQSWKVSEANGNRVAEAVNLTAEADRS